MLSNINVRLYIEGGGKAAARVVRTQTDDGRRMVGFTIDGTDAAELELALSSCGG